MIAKTNQLTLLQLAAAQLSLSLEETEKPFNDLTKLFLDIIEKHQEISLMLQKPSIDIEQVNELHKQTEDKVKTAVMDFQFYDRMSQRLHHILSNIQQAMLVINDLDKFQREEEWEKIFDSIEKSYTMQEEKDLFLAIKSGEGFESAVKKLIEKTHQKEAIEASIELF